MDRYFNGHASSSSRFDTTRDGLLNSGLYLGDENFEIDQVVWKRIGFDNCLVTKSSADAVDAANAATDTTFTPEEDSKLPFTPEYDLAILSAVVHITNDDFFMTPCGYWRGPTQFCRNFSDIKLNCTGKSPSETPFRKDFPTLLANLTAVADLSWRFTNKKGLFVERPPGHRKIKFRHVLFEVTIRSPSLVKPLINLIMNRSCPNGKKIHLDQTPHQKATVSNTTTSLITCTNFWRPIFRTSSRIPHRELAMRTRRCKGRSWPNGRRVSRTSYPCLRYAVQPCAPQPIPSHTQRRRSGHSLHIKTLGIQRLWHKRCRYR
jgi:hypothetical protein